MRKCLSLCERQGKRTRKENKEEKKSTQPTEEMRVGGGNLPKNKKIKKSSKNTKRGRKMGRGTDGHNKRNKE